MPHRRMSHGQQIFWVGLGGAVGAIGRHGLLVWLGTVDDGNLPWGTVAANLTGSLLLGMVIGVVDRGGLIRPLRLFLAIGLLGGFTTFSFFSYENLELLREERVLAFLTNAALQVVAGLLAAAAGYAITRRPIR
jgi:fluoride exporter